MPQKEIVFHSFITPYDWSYNHDKKMWYEDDKEFMPPPKAEPEKTKNFDILYEAGTVCWDGCLLDSEEEINEERTRYMDYLVGKDLIKDTFSFTLVFKTDKNTVYMPLNYTGEIESQLYDFLNKVKVEKSKIAITYLQEFADLKLYVYRLQNGKIRLVIQNYYENAFPNEPWKIFMDVVLNREDFIRKYVHAIQYASGTFYGHASVYAAQNFRGGSWDSIMEKHGFKYLKEYEK